jgi:ubiquinone biosynthesis protein
VRNWMERQLGPIGRLEETGRGLRTLAGVIADLPELSLRAERLLEKFERAADQGFPLAAESLEGIGRAEARRARWQAVALWVIALLLAILIIRS